MGSVIQLFDSLRNALTGMGTNRDPRIASTYFAQPYLTAQQIDAAYRGSGLMRKIIQIPALDMAREWRDWKLKAEEITAVEAEEKRLGIRQKIRQAEVLRGLGGGALILGLPGEPSQPAPEGVQKGGLAYVHVVSRWHLTFEKLQDDLMQPGFGEPAMWRMQTSQGQTQQIHPSRVIPFRADTAIAISIAMPAEEQFWGESTVAQVLDAVKNNDTAQAGFAALIHKARLLRIGIPGLSEIAATEDGQTGIQNRLATVALAESLHNATIFDSGDGEGKGGEKIEDATYSFAGAKDVLNAYAEFASAISDIPATRLLGRAPEGMNASGDSQQRDWGKMVRARQTLVLSPCLDRLDPYLLQSALGTAPDGQWYEWAPLDQPTEKENAERFKTQMEAAQQLQMTAAIPDQAFARGLQSLMIDEGYLPELESALLKLPEDERWGVVPTEPEIDPETGLPRDPGNPDPNEPAQGIQDAAPRTLYVRRDLLNGADLIKWAKSQGFETTLPASDMHVTVLYSKTAVDWMKMGSPWDDGKKGELTVPPGGARLVEPLGDEGAVVLLFSSSALSWRHEDMVRNGASHDFDEYQPHVTITYDKPEGLDLSQVEPYRGELRFGPEIFEELDEEWANKLTEA